LEEWDGRDHRRGLKRTGKGVLLGVQRLWKKKGGPQEIPGRGGDWGGGADKKKRTENWLGKLHRPECNLGGGTEQRKTLGLLSDVCEQKERV